MKENLVGACLLAVSFSGILFTTFPIFFGLLPAGMFLVIYGSAVNTERESKSHIFPTDVETTTFFCPYCGKRLEKKLVIYCPNCGEKIN